VFDPQCCRLCIFVGRGSCVRSIMLLSLYVCGDRVDPQSCCFCIFVDRAYWIYESSVFHSRYSVSLWGQRLVLCSINAPLSLSIFVGSCVSLCIFVSLLGERLYIFVGDWIYESLVFDPRSTQLAPHNSTSNQLITLLQITLEVRRPFPSIQIILTFLTHSNYLSILDACLLFFDLCFNVFVIKNLG